ncbi:MAG: AAA family ATPase [Phycisphaerae bacterium]|nr:AAA family ATPase [Phycisphaerae bacterium]
MPALRTVHIKRFKNIEDAPFDLDKINVIVGANNSGKSSILQAIHFAIGTIQSMNLQGFLSGGGGSRRQTVDPSKLIYVPSENVHALGSGGRLWEDAHKSVQIELTLDSGNVIGMSVLKGRNRNIQVSLSDVSTARSIANLEQPFTIFTPGLAGIAKAEQHVSDGVLLRTIARGDANIVLRNTLLRLWDERTSNENWNKFIFDLKEIFPSIDIQVKYATRTDEFINVYIDTEAGEIPLELAGTGVLQTVQILSYINYFSPRIIVIDEPDSHLHPNNQRLLCSLLSMIADDRGVQILLSTHSRHVIDSLQGTARLLWVRAGKVEPVLDASVLSILLDLGALDIKEQIRAAASRFIVLTEDEIPSSLKVLLESSGLDMSLTVIKSYYGCTSPHNLRPLIQTIREINENAIIIVHKDRDYYTDTEIGNWETQIRNMGAEPFATDGVDIESHFLNPEYLASVNRGLSLNQAQSLVQTSVDASYDDSISHYVNGRCEIEKKDRTFGRLNLGNLAAQAPRVYRSDPKRYYHSKTVMSKLRQLFQEQFHRNLEAKTPSPLICSQALSTIVRRVSSSAT